MPRITPVSTDSEPRPPGGTFNERGVFVTAGDESDKTAEWPRPVFGYTGTLHRERIDLNLAQQWPRPVFGYTGTLHRERVDLELVVALARAHPKGSVVLVGPQHWTDDSLKRARLRIIPICTPLARCPIERFPK